MPRKYILFTALAMGLIMTGCNSGGALGVSVAAAATPTPTVTVTVAPQPSIASITTCATTTTNAYSIYLDGIDLTYKIVRFTNGESFVKCSWREPSSNIRARWESSDYLSADEASSNVCSALGAVNGTTTYRQFAFAENSGTFSFTHSGNTVSGLTTANFDPSECVTN